MESNEDFSNYVPTTLSGSKTEKNLETAFCGESKARNKYTFFADKAKQEGLIEISRIFEETANNEYQHGKIWFKLLNEGNIPETKKNLELSIQAENYESDDMYKKFAEEAKEEGFDDISKLFERIRKIEKMHAQRYEALLKELESNTVYERETNTIWECSKCGYGFTGKKAPEECPFCKHPKGYFFEKCIK